MAERVDVVKDLEKEIICHSCQDHYIDPKVLPCLHYYCKQCIYRLALRTNHSLAPSVVQMPGVNYVLGTRLKPSVKSVPNSSVQSVLRHIRCQQCIHLEYSARDSVD